MMPILPTSVKYLPRLCKENAPRHFPWPRLSRIILRNFASNFWHRSHHEHVFSCDQITLCRNPGRINSTSEGISYSNTPRCVSFTRNIQTCKRHHFRFIPECRTSSRDKIIRESKEKGDFRDNLDALVAESIKEEDMGPKNNDEVDDEDEIFISHSGKMLMFPWRLVNTSREGWSDGERKDRREDKTKYPSVTGILQKTMSPDSAVALLRWERFMIKKMGLPAFLKYKKEMFSEGHQLHANIGHVILNNPEKVAIDKNIEGFWNSIKERLPELVSDSPIIECHTKHPYLGYHGYADCITEYRGKPCLVEFKTSRKPKKSLAKCFDSPVQVAAYLGAFNFDSHHQFQINQALLVITYKDGSPADLHVMTSDLCDLYWKKWLRRLQEYREIESRQTAAEH
ncbi:mitochondrial genome maintenance exonuclease 1-like [Lytechinus pictus]|uniref:mitochondrial genome maintenance exonuclease 1-like n=1 Tax=Lytechinus pictus TaxID=7653 RepID=UPI0030B9E5C8